MNPASGTNLTPKSVAQPSTSTSLLLVVVTGPTVRLRAVEVPLVAAVAGEPSSTLALAIPVSSVHSTYSASAAPFDSVAEALYVECTELTGIASANVLD